MKRETPAQKAIKKAARKLLDMQFEGEVEEYSNSTTRNKDDQISKPLECSLLICDLALEYAANTGGRGGLLIANNARREIRPELRKVVDELADELYAIRFADYPGGPKQARLDEVCGRIAIYSNALSTSHPKILKQVAAEGRLVLDKLPKTTRNQLAKLIAHVNTLDEYNTKEVVQ